MRAGQPYGHITLVQNPHRNRSPTPPPSPLPAQQSPLREVPRSLLASFSWPANNPNPLPSTFHRVKVHLRPRQAQRFEDAVERPQHSPDRLIPNNNQKLPLRAHKAILAIIVSLIGLHLIHAPVCSAAPLHTASTAVKMVDMQPVYRGPLPRLFHKFFNSPQIIEP